METFEQYQEKDGLLAPCSFWHLGEEYLVQKGVCNGIGPARSSLRVPQRLLGVDVRSPGNIHDFGYEFSSTIEQKRFQDSLFLLNLFNLIDRSRKRRIIKKIIALLYYIVVFHFGNKAFKTKLSPALREEVKLKMQLGLKVRLPSCIFHEKQSDQELWRW